MDPHATRGREARCGWVPGSGQGPGHMGPGTALGRAQRGLVSRTARSLDPIPERRFQGKPRGVEHPEDKIKQLTTHARQ